MPTDQIRVLLADDSHDFLLLWGLLLRGHPRIAEVEHASTGAEAISRLAAGADIDVVLADVCMADGSGYDVADFARSGSSDVPVVLTSCAEGVEGEALRHGATAYVPKAETIGDALAAILCDVVDRQRMASSAA